MKTELFIAPAIRPLLHACGLDDLARLLAGDLGELLRVADNGRELRRLTLCGPQGTERFFLKRLGAEPPLRLLRSCLSGHRPRSGPLREMQALKALHQAGFAAMEPVAWGESRRFGLPTAGFLLVREVPGDDVAELFCAADAAQRQALCEAVGELIGRLHTAGFYQVVRLKDLIRDRHTGQLVLIDRETGKPWPGRFDRHKALASLARAGRRTLRDGYRFGPASLRHLLTGYANGLATVWRTSPAQLRPLVMKKLRSEMPRGR